MSTIDSGAVEGETEFWFPAVERTGTAWNPSSWGRAIVGPTSARPMPESQPSLASITVMIGRTGLDGQRRTVVRVPEFLVNAATLCGPASHLSFLLRASVRRHRRAQGGSPMLRSIRPKRAVSPALARTTALSVAGNLLRRFGAGRGPPGVQAALQRAMADRASRLPAARAGPA